MAQPEAESNLNFVGFAVLHNAPKPESAPVIRTLHAAGLRCLMVTGDNMLTACHVARECALVGSDDIIAVATCAGDDGGPYHLSLELSDADFHPGLTFVSFTLLFSLVCRYLCIAHLQMAIFDCPTLQLTIQRHRRHFLSPGWTSGE
jgi:magnesium-transporting ATPase (P-type)